MMKRLDCIPINRYRLTVSFIGFVFGVTGATFYFGAAAALMIGGFYICFMCKLDEFVERITLIERKEK